MADENKNPEVELDTDGVKEETIQLETPENTGSAFCLLYTSPSPRDGLLSRMPSSA